MRNRIVFLLPTIFLFFCASMICSAYGDIIIDNGTPGTSQTGTWYVISGAKSYGGSSLYARYGATYTWQFNSQPAGLYEVYIWWSESNTRPTNVAVVISHRDGKNTLSVNQRQNSGRWNSLGQYYFESSGSVRITAANNYLATCADAVRFSPVSSTTPPVAEIVSITPGSVSYGNMVTLTGRGTDSDGTITAYNWRSSIDGNLSTSASFSTPALSEGLHTIYFKVKDNNGLWSTEVTMTVTVTTQDTTVEHIYFGLLYSPSTADETSLIQLLNGIGAHSEGTNIWTYRNFITGKKFTIHIVKDMETMKQALYTRDTHIIMKGHANYGYGAVFIPDNTDMYAFLSNIRYIDDDLIFNYSSPWVAVTASDAVNKHLWTNWQPIFKDGTSGVMPYKFGDPRGDPPYNYYITYQVPGDPTYYKVETAHNSALEKFFGSRKPAWFSSDGSLPDPTNPDHLQYYITASGTPSGRICGTAPCPATHYGRKTITFRRELEIEPDKLKYKRMFYDACRVGNYYMDSFHRGIMFYSVSDSYTNGSFPYLNAYLAGKSDHDIWTTIQVYQPAYDYFDFSKRPSEQ
jgi:hypothetical protein